jgi:hypothetical protein
VRKHCVLLLETSSVQLQSGGLFQQLCNKLKVSRNLVLESTASHAHAQNTKHFLLEPTVAPQTVLPCLIGVHFDFDV